MKKRALFDREDVCNRGLRSDFVGDLCHVDTCVGDTSNGMKDM